MLWPYRCVLTDATTASRRRHEVVDHALHEECGSRVRASFYSSLLVRIVINARYVRSSVSRRRRRACALSYATISPSRTSPPPPFFIPLLVHANIVRLGAIIYQLLSAQGGVVFLRCP